MDECVSRGEELLSRVIELYRDVILYLAKLGPKLKQEALSQSELVDVGYFCNRIDGALEDLRREVKAKKTLAGRIVAWRWTKSAIENPDSVDERVEGAYAWGYPKIRYVPQTLNPESKSFKPLCEFLGVSADMVSSKIARLHWPAVVDELTRRAESGDQPPGNILQPKPEYSTEFRRRTKGGLPIRGAELLEREPETAEETEERSEM